MTPMEPQPHLHMIEALQQLPADLPVTLLMRHSWREQAEQHTVSYQVPLTPAGVKAAEQWGAILAGRLQRFCSSPVPRCQDTARAMMSGAGSELALHADQQLAEPGCYVTDMAQAGPHFMQHGPVKFTEDYLQQPLPGVRSAREGSGRLLAFLLEHCAGKPGGISVHISHDTVLAALVYHLLEASKLNEADWPLMLEGVFLWQQQDQLHWLWRGQKGERELAHQL